MVRLFVSDRILIDGNFCAGGIVVNNSGTIDEVFKSQNEVEQWLDSNSHIEVINNHFQSKKSNIKIV